MKLFSKSRIILTSLVLAIAVGSSPAFADVSSLGSTIKTEAKSLANTTENKAQELYYSYKPTSKASKEATLDNGAVKAYLYKESKGNVITIHANNTKLLSQKYTLGNTTVYASKDTSLTQINQALLKLGLTEQVQQVLSK
ncbi:hypothetical protein CJP74_05525 [Psittacicella melopsittaci]|uniref:Uncharacterized protein n=1 Tax=Psittacicella melopsittaci TaxID=2028576 RepID=A0A3A1Y4B7_9GAMM|nr:hypothetical protein [Psittacicella melopsittaci]RIY32106.1 hypothetical protein CJP74_05525 [Psittacicella melopsittaci]